VSRSSYLKRKAKKIGVEKIQLQFTSNRQFFEEIDCNSVIEIVTAAATVLDKDISVNRDCIGTPSTYTEGNLVVK
jgi:hypothetical protein